MAGMKLHGKEYFAYNLSRAQGISQDKALEIVRFLFDNIADTVAGGGRVKLGDLGTIHLRERAERPGTDPRTGVSITIPRTFHLKANISSTMRKQLLEKTDEGE